MHLRLVLFFSLLGLIGCTSSPKVHPSSPCTSLLMDHYFDGQEEHRGEKTFTIQSEFLTERPLKGCTTLDLREKTVLPGLIDAHTHVLLTDRGYGAETSKEILRDSERPIADRISEARIHLRSLLFAGFTSIRDLGNSGSFEDLKLKNTEPGPHIFASGPGLAFATAQFPPDASNEVVAREYRILGTLTDPSTFVIENQARGADVVKVYADLDPQPGLMKQEWLDAVVSASKPRGLRVAAHATTDASAARAVKAGVDTIEHGLELSSRTLGMMKKKRIVLVATDFGARSCEMISSHDPSPDYHPCTRYTKRMSKRLLAARDAGVTIAFGSDMYLALDAPLNDRGQASLDSLFALNEEGLTALETLRAATAGAAEAIGRADIGRIGEHARADLVVYEGDPLQDIKLLKSPALVVKDGQIVCGFTSKTKCSVEGSAH